MNVEKSILLEIFCEDFFKGDDFKVTSLSLFEAKVEDKNKDIIYLLAKDNNIIECYESNRFKPFKKLQLVETITNSFDFAWKVLK